MGNCEIIFPGGGMREREKERGKGGEEREE
jgi:hypothetical protein